MRNLTVPSSVSPEMTTLAFPPPNSTTDTISAVSSSESIRPPKYPSISSFETPSGNPDSVKLIPGVAIWANQRDLNSEHAQQHSKGGGTRGLGGL